MSKTISTLKSQPQTASIAIAAIKTIFSEMNIAFGGLFNSTIKKDENLSRKYKGSDIFNFLSSYDDDFIKPKKVLGYTIQATTFQEEGKEDGPAFILKEKGNDVDITVNKDGAYASLILYKYTEMDGPASIEVEKYFSGVFDKWFIEYKKAVGTSSPTAASMHIGVKTDNTKFYNLKKLWDYNKWDMDGDRGTIGSYKSIVAFRGSDDILKFRVFKDFDGVQYYLDICENDSVSFGLTQDLGTEKRDDLKRCLQQFKSFFADAYNGSKNKFNKKMLGDVFKPDNLYNVLSKHLVGKFLCIGEFTVIRNRNHLVVFKDNMYGLYISKDDYVFNKHIQLNNPSYFIEDEVYKD